MNRYRRFFNLVDDDFGLPSVELWSLPVFTNHYHIYNPDEYELTPKPDQRKKLITQTEEEIEQTNKKLETLRLDLAKLKEGD